VARRLKDPAVKLISRTRPEAATQPVEWLELAADDATYRVCRYLDTGKVVRVLHIAPGPGGVRVTRALDLDSTAARRAALAARMAA
jgi:hypothetical protein